MSGVVRGHACPTCGGDIVYNGNYYCRKNEQGETCWIMHPDNLSKRDHAIIASYLRQERARYTRLRDEEGVARMDFYLEPYDVE